MARFFSLVVVFLLCASFSCVASNKIVDVDTLCKDAMDPKFCSTLIKSKPGAERDLVSLASYTLDVAHRNASNILKRIKKLMAQSGSNRKQVFLYKRCLHYFGSNVGVLYVIGQITQLLKSKDYFDVGSYGSSIIAYVEYCVSGEYPAEVVHFDVPSFPKYARVVEKVVDALILISINLQK